MKREQKKKAETVKVSKAGLLALVASQIKGKDLFPKKTENARKILEHARIVKK